jgi:hypothetical protein
MEQIATKSVENPDRIGFQKRVRAQVSNGRLKNLSRGAQPSEGKKSKKKVKKRSAGGWLADAALASRTCARAQSAAGWAGVGPVRSATFFLLFNCFNFRPLKQLIKNTEKIRKNLCSFTEHLGT